jgi:hypothetical protein
MFHVRLLTQQFIGAPTMRRECPLAQTLAPALPANARKAATMARTGTTFAKRIM